MKSWPIFASSDTSSTTSTILFGNIWSCPIEPAIRDHSDDEAHAYACGDSEFVTPILVAAAAFALFAAAVAFTKHENVYRLVCYYSRSKTVVLTDARKVSMRSDAPTLHDESNPPHHPRSAARERRLLVLQAGGRRAARLDRAQRHILECALRVRHPAGPAEAVGDPENRLRRLRKQPPPF